MIAHDEITERVRNAIAPDVITWKGILRKPRWTSGRGFGYRSHPVVLVGQTRPDQIGGTASPLSRELVALKSCVFGQEFTTLCAFSSVLSVIFQPGNMTSHDKAMPVLPFKLEAFPFVNGQ